MRQIPFCELVFDFDLYPRQQVDSGHLANMRAADEAGVEFPPIVVDKKSKRIVDGFHRARLRRLVDGKDAKVPAVEKSYSSDQEMFLDAMRLNASHGRNLSSFDRTHAILRAKVLGIEAQAIASALSISQPRVEQLLVSKSAMVGRTRVPIKRTIRHMAGKKLSKQQHDVNRKLGGMEPAFYANQLIMLLENNLIDKENEELFERLKTLHELLETALAVV